MLESIIDEEFDGDIKFFKQVLERSVGSVTDEEFKMAMEITNRDILNHITFCKSQGETALNLMSMNLNFIQRRLRQ